jgi:hydrogenase maturation protease
MTIAPQLVIGIGNPSRGDDAIGPRFLERAAEELGPWLASGELELQTDFQLQPEHAVDLRGRRRVVFVDASVSAPVPFSFERVEARRDESWSSHAMSPEAVLDAYRASFGAPPEAFVLAIRGERFELGDPLTAPAVANLEAALSCLVARVLRDEW